MGQLVIGGSRLHEFVNGLLFCFQRPLKDCYELWILPAFSEDGDDGNYSGHFVG